MLRDGGVTPHLGSEESFTGSPKRSVRSTDIAGRNRAVGVVRIERLQLQCLRGPAFQFLIITSPPRVFTTTRSPRRISGVPGDTTMTSPSR